MASPEYSRCDSISKLASKTGTKDDISTKIGKKKLKNTNQKEKTVNYENILKILTVENASFVF